METWKDIKGYEGLYQVSDEGRIKSLGGERYKKERILKGNISAKGYIRVNLFKNGKFKTYNVHRLVAETFIPNLDNKPCIDHCNTIRTDNRLENLCWCTYEENNNNLLTKQKMSYTRKRMELKRNEFGRFVKKDEE